MVLEERGGGGLSRFGGSVIEKVVAPVAGLLTGIRRHPLLFEGDLILRVNRKG